MRAVLALAWLGLPVLPVAAMSRLLFRGLPRGVTWMLRVVGYSLVLLLPAHLLGSLELAGAGLRPTLPAICVVEAIPASAALWLLLRKRGSVSPVSAARDGAPATRLSRLTAAGIGIAAAGYGIFAVNALTSFPRSWDGNAYHLPIALRWLQDGSMRVDPSRAWTPGFGANAEVFMMALLGAAPQGLVFLAQILPTFGLVLAAYSIARRLGAGRDAGAAATLVLASVPIVIYQTFSAYVDLFGSSYLLMGLALFLALEPGRGDAESGRRNTILLTFAALSCGIALGTKPVFVFSVVLFAATALAVLWRRTAARFGLTLAGSVLAAAAGLLAPSAFWFSRSIGATGNPLFPADLRVGGVSLHGPLSTRKVSLSDHNDVKALSRLLRYPWTEAREGVAFYSADSGLGAPFATFVPLAIGYLVARGSSGRAPPLAVILLVWVVLGAAVWRLQMGSVLRYGLPLILLGCILSCSLLEVLLRAWRRPAALLFLVSLATAFSLASVDPVLSILWRAREGAWSHRRFYGLPPIVERLPEGARLLNWTGEGRWNFPLAGGRLENRVVNTFEAPSRLTQEFLERNVDYVIARRPAADREAELASLGPVLEEEAASDEDSGDRTKGWRVWRVVRTRAAGVPSGRSRLPSSERFSPLAPPGRRRPVARTSWMTSQRRSTPARICSYDVPP